MAELKIIKLTNGDDVIGFIETDPENISQGMTEEEFKEIHCLFVRGALKLEKKYIREADQHQVMLLEWAPETDDPIIPICDNNVIAVYNPGVYVRNLYYDIAMDNMSEHEKKEVGEKEVERHEEQKAVDKNSELYTQLNSHNFDDDDIQ